MVDDAAPKRRKHSITRKERKPRTPNQTKTNTENITDLFPRGTRVTTETWKYDVSMRFAGDGNYEGGVWTVKGWPNNKAIEQEYWMYAMKAKLVLATKIDDPQIVPPEHTGLNEEEEILKELEKLDAARRTHFPEFYDKGYTARVLGNEKLPTSQRIYFRFIMHTAMGFTAVCTIWKKEAVANIAKQVLEALRHLHTAGFVHQAINPGFIAFKYSEPTVAFLLGFRHARRIDDNSESKKRGLKCLSEYFCPRDLNTDAPEKVKLGPKHDVEAFIYTLIDLHRENGLPWHNIKDRRGTLAIKNIAHQDFDRSLETYRQANLPGPVSWVPKVNPMLTHLEKLKGDELPDHDLLEKHLQTEYKAAKLDWTSTKGLKEQQDSLPPKY